MSNPNSGWRFTQQTFLPPYIADAQGRAFEATFGATKDDATDLYREAVKARYPSATRPDALPYQAHDRLILRAPPETDAEFADRLTEAPDLWVWGGTPTAIVNIFAPYGYDATDCVVIPNYSIILEGDLRWFSRSIDLCSALYWSADTTWDNPVDTWPDEPTQETWDSTALVGDLDYLRGSIRTFKSDEAYPVFIGVQLLGAPGDGMWDQLPQDFYDEPNTVWTDDTDDVIFWPLGRLWDDEPYYGGAIPKWDDLVDNVWEGDPFVPPTFG